MISPETQIDVLAEIAKNTDRIANALESLVKRETMTPEAEHEFNAKRNQ